MTRIIGILRISGLSGFLLFIVIILAKSSNPTEMDFVRNSLRFKPFNLLSILFVITFGSFVSIVVLQLYQLYMQRYLNDEAEED
jgi:nitrate/nitrite transporter NarK